MVDDVNPVKAIDARARADDEARSFRLGIDVGVDADGRRPHAGGCGRAPS